jgi:hypothetical protein
MNLMELLDSGKFVDNEGAVALKTGLPFSWSTEAVIVNLDDSFEIPIVYKEQKFEGFLECCQIQSIWEALKSKAMSSRAKAELIVHFAAYDSYPAWLQDIPEL